ncbi:MAG: FAD/NAD(P)-binding protein [Polyangiaceae bacterium]
MIKALDTLLATLRGIPLGAPLSVYRDAVFRVNLTKADVEPYVEERVETYARRRVARAANYEVFVMTWRKGQGSIVHDHAGAHCVVRVIAGVAEETFHSVGPDGLTEPVRTWQTPTGSLLQELGAAAHSVRNAEDASETLVTLHVYAPALPELRRYSPRAGAAPLPVFLRTPASESKCIAIVGGGFSGTLTAAHLIAKATKAKAKVHIVLTDRQASFGSGPAYGTLDARHLLNVPAGRMSAWPDKPNHFFEWAKARDESVQPSSFVSRSLFGTYLREVLFEIARDAGESVSMEIRQGEIEQIARTTPGAWTLSTKEGPSVTADAVVLALGHRPPSDPLEHKWHGSRARFVADPWASLTLSTVLPDEPVLVLGSGLTAVDVLLTLTKVERTAPILFLSRRGFLPASHAEAPLAPIDLGPFVASLLGSGERLTTLKLLRGFRAEIRRTMETGGDWRAVVDAIRPHTASLWSALPPVEAARFLRHVRAHWEVRRHRMSPQIGKVLSGHLATGLLRVARGTIVSARGDDDGVSAELRLRGDRGTQSLRTSWVVNCTGPADMRGGLPTPLSSLLAAGHVKADPLALGLRTGPSGEAEGEEGLQTDLFVLGTLCKPRFWESTAVPDLRVQAANVATSLFTHVVAR